MESTKTRITIGNLMGKNFYEKLRIRCTWFLVIFITVLMSVSMSFWEPLPIIEEVLMFLACILASIGAFGRIWCSIYIAGRKDSELVQAGPYALCRNPLYFFSMLGSIGVGLATETVTIPLLILLAFVIYYPTVIISEEKRLALLFGEEYIQYKLRVPSFFPRLSLLKGSEPDSYTMNPIVFRRSFLDALWFIWLIGILEFLSGCHEAGLLPNILRLY